MGNYLNEVWRCRYFWSSLVKMDLRTRYRRSVLGMGWSLLHPIAMTAVLCVVFARIWHQDLRACALYIFAGMAPWNYIVTVSLTGCECLFNGERYIRQYPAPMTIYPLRTALGGGIHFLIALAVVFGVAGFMNGFVHPLALLSLIPSLIILFVLGWSLAVLAGFANVFFQDTKHLAEIGFQMLFYASPIIYRPDDLGGGRLTKLVTYNPIGSFLELIRQPILHGQLPSPTTYGIACGFAVGAAALAVVTLIRWERRLIFYL